eukprot:748813-Hanusia_phi.AAC.1
MVQAQCNAASPPPDHGTGRWVGMVGQPRDLLTVSYKARLSIADGHSSLCSPLVAETVRVI